ncbi:MAG: hypothetical protein ACE5GE_01630 [Phycisphaerae bacterium]
MRTRRTYLLLLLSLASLAALGQSNIDMTDKHAWGVNMGWTNWRDGDASAAGVVVGRTFMGGFIWAENVGWINVGDGTPADGIAYANSTGADFGVNVDPVTGELVGLAWGENIGWVNFEGGALATPPSPARVDFCTRQIFGFVWGENVGWINLDDATHFVALGPCGDGDYDCNATVDLTDYEAFPMVLQGPDLMADCPAFDVDGDNDVDLRDFSTLQTLMP